MNARPSVFALALVAISACSEDVSMGSGDPATGGDGRTPPGPATSPGPTPTTPPPPPPDPKSTVHTACVGVAGLQANAPWPMLGGCTTHQGRSAYAPAATLPLKWSRSTLGSNSLGAYLSPSVAADGSLYAAATGTGNPAAMFALTPAGDPKWSLSIMKSVHFGWAASAIAKDGTIYVAPSNFGEIGAPWESSLYALDASGATKWVFDTGGASPQPAGVRDDGVVVIGAYGHVFAVNPDGSKLWDFPVPSGITGAPAIGADGTVYAGSDQTLYAIDPTGKQKWAYAAAHGVDGTPVVADDGTVIVRASYDHLLAVTPAGALAWDYAITSDTPLNYGGGLGQMPAVAADGTIYATHNFALHAIGPDGKVKWNQPAVQALSAPIIAADGSILVTTTDDKIVRVASNGDVMSSMDGPPGATTIEALNGSPVLGANGHLYVAAWGVGLADFGP